MSPLSDLQEDVSPDRVAELHAAGEVELVDVREPYEHEAGHIGGDRHVPFARLADAAGSIDKARPVVFYCRTGGRSATATQAFRASGYDAHNMVGGFVAWTGEGRPIEPEDGSVADH